MIPQDLAATVRKDLARVPERRRTPSNDSIDFFISDAIDGVDCVEDLGRQQRSCFIARAGCPLAGHSPSAMAP
jgi:hypothetical protein